MIIKNEIELHQKSIDYVKDTFSQYVQVNELKDVIIDPIIHIYPVEDTFDNSGDLNGFTDALFFKTHIYDTDDMTVYKDEKLHDGILPYTDWKVSQIKIFKDLSTMIVLKGEYHIGLYQALDVNRVR